MKYNEIINDLVTKILKNYKYDKTAYIDSESDPGDRIFIENYTIRTWNIYERRNKLYIEYSLYNTDIWTEHGYASLEHGRYVLNTDTNKSRIYRD